MQYFRPFGLKYNGNLPTNNLEKLCPQSLALASTIPIVGFEMVYPQNIRSWSRNFFESLNLASKLMSSTAPLLDSLMAKLSGSHVMFFLPL